MGEEGRERGRKGGRGKEEGRERKGRERGRKGGRGRERRLGGSEEEQQGGLGGWHSL